MPSDAPTSAQSNEVQQLEHLNKSRPRRPNVKRPTVKNPQAQIEIVPDSHMSTAAAAAASHVHESDSMEHVDERMEAEAVAAPVVEFEQQLSVSLSHGDLLAQTPAVSQPKAVSPVLKNSVEQPKVR